LCCEDFNIVPVAPIVLTSHLYFVHLQLVKDGHHLFADWTPQEQKRLGLEKLSKKYCPRETYGFYNFYLLQNANSL